MKVKKEKAPRSLAASRQLVRAGGRKRRLGIRAGSGMQLVSRDETELSLMEAASVGGRSQTSYGTLWRELQEFATLHGLPMPRTPRP